MLVNYNNRFGSNNNHVEFVSYTGKWPNLCSGILTLRIDGDEYKFGHDYSSDNYDQFWSSGGSCGFDSFYKDSHCSRGEWRINVNNIPDQFKKYAVEINEVFNDNVPYGCCGGCL